MRVISLSQVRWLRGLCIATGAILLIVRECSGFLILAGSDDMEVDEQDREQVDSEGESRGARGRGRKQNKNRQRTLKHVMTRA